MYWLGSLLHTLGKGDAEKAHALGVQLARYIQKRPLLLEALAKWHKANDNPRPCTVFGIRFPNRLGWASGFDKQAETILLMQALGFGFGMVGTVLPEAQFGNPKPRYFYLREDKALINRFGFNSDGALLVEDALQKVMSRVHIPLGISLGKMKATRNEEAAADYIAVWKWLWKYGAFAVANVSSPNTPGLRDLQGGRYLETFITGIVRAGVTIAQAHEQLPRPLLVKIAPDLSEAELDESIEACERGGASGIVMGNTTLTRPVKYPESALAKETGGLSGEPLFTLMQEKFRLARKRTKLPMIAVGGITSTERARRMLDEGADLIKIYSGFVYQGPPLVDKIRAAI